jgi:AraC family transcriptional regulator
MGWEGFIVRHYRLPPFEVPEHPLVEHRILIQLGGQNKVEATQNGRLLKGRFLNGDITYTTPGVKFKARWEEEREFLIVRLEPAFVTRAAREFIRKDLVETVPQFKFRDPLVEGIGRALGAELESDGPLGRLYAESLAHVLVVHLLRNYSGSTRPLRAAIGELPKHKLRRATEFINDNLGRDVTLTEVAASVEMSPYHFARMFKQSTGLAPHQYRLERKIERAKTLLSETALPIAEIAYRLDFASQSHFTALFRRFTSTTPKAYRKGL